MSLVASVDVSALPLFGGVHLDADAQGRAVLGWQHLRGSRFVVEVADVRDGRLAGPPRRLWRSGGNADLGDLDVAGSGSRSSRGGGLRASCGWRPARRSRRPS